VPAAPPPARRWPKRLLIGFLVVANLGIFGGLGAVWWAANRVTGAVATLDSSELGLAQTPAEAVAHQQAAVRATKEFESQVRGRVAQGLETQASLQFAVGQRLTAEIGLVRAQRAAEPRPPQK